MSVAHFPISPMGHRPSFSMMTPSVSGGPTIATVTPEVAAIFAQNSIDGVKAMEHKMRMDVERKKDQLRSIVGERYRDLIESADLITSLSKSSKQLVSEVETLKSRLADMAKLLNDQQKQQQLQQMDTQEAPTDDDQLSKVLVQLPEKIWDCMTESRLVDAALLSIYAGDLIASLQLARRDNLIDNSLAAIRLPRVRQKLVAAIREQVASRREPVTSISVDNSFANAITAVIAIDYLTPVQALDSVLICRMEGLEKSLANSDLSLLLADRITNVFQLLVSTLVMANYLFIENPKALDKELALGVARLIPAGQRGSSTSEFASKFGLSDRPENLAQLATALPTFCHSNLSKLANGLSKTCFQVSGQLDEELVTQKLAVWLDSVAKLFDGRLTQLLSAVSSTRQLQIVCEAVGNTFKQYVIPSYTKLPSEYRLWEQFVAPFVLSQFVAIVESKFDALKSELLQSLESGTIRKPSFCSHNGQSALPMRISTPTPAMKALSMKQQSGATISNISSDLFVVGQFVSPAFSASLQSTVASMESLLVESQAFVKAAIPSHATERRDEALACLKKGMTTFMERLQETCRNFLTNTEQNRLLDVASFSFGLVFLAGYSEKWCSSISQSSTTSPKSVNQRSNSADSLMPFWSDFRGQVTRLSAEAFERALAIYLSSEISEKFVDQLVAEATTKPAWAHRVQWAVIEIEEEGELGDKIKSKIYLPQDTSVTLWSTLTALSSFALQAPAFLLKSLSISSTIFATFVDAYTKFLEKIARDSIAVHQDCAIQHLFDFNFLVGFLVGDYRLAARGPNPPFTAATCIDIIHGLESHIDPFDLSTFSKHLTELVRQHCLTVQSILGVLSSSDSSRKPQSNISGKLVGNTADGSTGVDHTVLRVIPMKGRITPLLIPLSYQQACLQLDSS